MTEAPLTSLNRRHHANRHEDLLELCQQLVRIDSTTGQEGTVAAAIGTWLAQHDIEHSTVVVPDGWSIDWPAETDLANRPNVVARVPGTDPTAAPLVLNGHIDTVPVGDRAMWDRDPWCGDRVDGWLFGRGSADMKAGVAVAMIALRELVESEARLPFDVVLQCVIGEESGGIGTHYLAEVGPLPRAALILEPTGGRLFTACGGTAPFTIETYGRSAHVGTPWTGVDAMEQMIRIHGALRALEAEREATLTHPILGRLPRKVPMSFGVFRSGEWRLTTADHALLQGRIGTLPQERLDDVRAMVEAALEPERERSRADGVPVPRLTWDPSFSGWEIPSNHWFAEGLLQAIERCGGDREPGCATFGSDASVYADRGVPVALLGPGEQARAHTPNEAARESEITAVLDILLTALASWSEEGKESEA